MKDSFVTNMFLFKIGKNLELNKYMRAKDPDGKKWSPPFTSQAVSSENLSCTGKNIADGVESLLGAIFMSTNLFQTFKFISHIQLVPLKQARLLDIFPDKDLLFEMHDDLDAFQFSLKDNVDLLYKKYCEVQKVPI
jgi:dsRNA-specific ribonuclease